MRVLIADDQDFIRRGVRAVLSEEKDIEVCAEAVDGRDALVKSLEFRPDVVIMDIIMPRMDGIDAMRLIRKALPQVKIVSLSLYDVPEMVDEVEQAGAAAFVSKLLVWDNLVPLLREECSLAKRSFLKDGPQSPRNSVRKNYESLAQSFVLGLCLTKPPFGYQVSADV
jgi:DNA-binding NarL/FixJ family response regulator